VAWHIGYQDVIAIGKLFRTGKLDVTRVISLAGPQVAKPRLIESRLGASLDELTEGELLAGDNRVISGSVLGGRTAMGEIHGFLGRHMHQVTVLLEGREREFLGWLNLGINRYSTLNTFASRLIPNKRFAFTTSTHGSARAMVPIGMYERVMPFDLLPTFLLRAMIIDDVERAEALGILELDEEDVAPCTFVCPGKYEYGPILRRNLTLIEKEG
jgi:Na+-transporting NADH:ubiquinone oxidoreductase subunit A